MKSCEFSVRHRLAMEERSWENSPVSSWLSMMVWCGLELGAG